MTRTREIVLTALLGAGLGIISGIVSAAVSYGQLTERTARLSERVVQLEHQVDGLEKRPQPEDATKATCLDLARDLSQDFANDMRIKEAMRQAGCKVAS